MIRPASPADGAALCAIYNYYIENTIVTCEETPINAAEMDDRIRKISAKYPYLVWEEKASGTGAGEINGYAYVNTWKERSAYRYAAELSIYVRNGLHDRGIGRALMERLLEEVRKTDIHALVAGIALPNDRSVMLHEKYGFKKIAQFLETGYKFGKWLDIGYWELILK